MLREILNFFKGTPKYPDPVKLCQVYRIHGCAHVDGPLCNMNTCTDTVQLKITPWRVIPIEHVPEEPIDKREEACDIRMDTSSSQPVEAPRCMTCGDWRSEPCKRK